MVKEEQPKENISKKLKWYEHLAAGWLLLLVFMGGAIGGACGGLAYFLNTKFFNSRLSNSLKYTFSFLVGVAGFGLYFLIIVIITTLFPNSFQR